MVHAARLVVEINSGVQLMCDLAAVVPFASISPGGTGNPVLLC